jgi:hypothetical protein
MADTANYPQLPRNVWRGAWGILRKTPKRKLDGKALSAELGVQVTAAKTYARELCRLGLLNDDFAPSDLANRWRQDGKAADVIEEMLALAYPDDLRDMAPRTDLDRDKIVRWFMGEGLGEGSAKNKAATYIMVSMGVSEDEELPQAKPRRAASPAGPRTRQVPLQRTDKGHGQSGNGNDKPSKGKSVRQGRPDLNVNVQIHISADASVEQIDAIFSSMRRYFDESD